MHAQSSALKFNLSRLAQLLMLTSTVFFPGAIRLWNNLLKDIIIICDDVDSFKDSLHEIML